MSPAERLINRELSWLDFDQRVLALAADPSVPLLERVKFLAIFSQNLDEFYEVRVASLRDKVSLGVRVRSADGRTPTEQLRLIGERVAPLSRQATAVFVEQLIPALRAEGIRFVTWGELSDDERKGLTEVFDRQIYPVLTPLAVDPSHPFPYISNLSLNLAIIAVDPEDRQRRFARVKVPGSLPRFLPLPDGERFVPLEQVIAAHLDVLFPGMEIEGCSLFRVTRDADLDLDGDEALDLLAAIELEVRRRRFGSAVRLEVSDDMSMEVRALLQRELELGDEDTFATAGLLDFGGLWHIHAVDRPDLLYPPFRPVTPRSMQNDDGVGGNLFAAIDRGDILVHHPYESFATTVEEFVVQAASDPKVLAIKVTLYRTSGDSAMAMALMRAAEQGKQVVVLVELRARFDEENNIEWARRLEEAGVHVVYGVVGLKTHAKVALVVRQERSGVRRYCHLGTGNYNGKTARTYEDLGLFTASEVVGGDVSQLFNSLTGFGRTVEYDQLLVAPQHLRTQLVDLIRNERRHGSDGRIVMKMNGLVDPAMIDELYDAGADGVQVDLLVRGMCCLRPQVPGLSDNIRVRSIVGRYLEHSRVYWFANGQGDGVPWCAIGSADLMPRNLDGRVEVVAPITDDDLRHRIEHMLEVNLADDALAWELIDDRWRRVVGGAGVNTHTVLQERARRSIEDRTA